MRPAPEWVGAEVGMALPISRNRAGAGLRSTLRREQFFPEEPLPARSRATLEDLFGIE